MKTATKINLEIAECHELLAKLYRQQSRFLTPATDEVAEESPQPKTSDEHSFVVLFKLSDKMKGKFAIVIWALYRMKMFVKVDGSEAKSVREVANYIGQLFGLHFTEKEWKSTLEGSFKVLEPRRFFWEMAEKIQDRVQRLI